MCISVVRSDEFADVGLAKSTWVSQLSSSMSTSQFKPSDYDSIRESNIIKTCSKKFDDSVMTSRSRPLSSSIQSLGQFNLQGGLS
jgi:hypothetical protein